MEEIVERKISKKKSGSFKTMGLLPDVLKGVVRRGYTLPTPIQRRVIPYALEGKDVVAMARTGSGKTAAFVIPILNHLRKHSGKFGTRALVLCPTRELALQTDRFFKQLGRYLDVRSLTIVGGESIEGQFAEIASNPDIIVATPGRLVHHLMETKISLQTVDHVVLDEADRLFEMGFTEQITEIINSLSDTRQTMLFSATLPPAVADFAQIGLSDPELVRLDTDCSLSENLSLAFIVSKHESKASVLLYILKNFVEKQDQTIIFAATEHHVQFLSAILERFDFTVSHVYGKMDQTARKIHLGKFRNQKTDVLVVTDVAARGLDIPLLNNVINYDFPPAPKLFVHRVGRAARGGRRGTAYSIFSPDEVGYLMHLHEFLGRVPRDGSDGETNGSYGCIPQEDTDILQDMVNDCIRENDELSFLWKKSQNGFKKYSTTRPAPVPKYVLKGKQLNLLNIHPLLRKESKDNSASEEQQNILQQLRLFRPNMTALEEIKGSTSNVVMRKKREQHSFVSKKDNDTRTGEVVKDDTALSEKTGDDEYIPYTRRKNAVDRELSLSNKFMFGDNVVEVTPDDAEGLEKRKRKHVWDKKKKKYTQVQETLSWVEKWKKRRRNESGAVIEEGKPGTDSFRKWRKRSRVQMPQEGDNEETSAAEARSLLQRKRARHNGDELKHPEQILKERRRKLKEKLRVQNKMKHKGKKTKKRG